MQLFVSKYFKFSEAARFARLEDFDEKSLSIENASAFLFTTIFFDTNIIFMKKKHQLSHLSGLVEFFS